MADLPLYVGDTIVILWFGISHECRVYQSDERCWRCDTKAIKIDPPCSGWSLLCGTCSALTTTNEQNKAAMDNLQPEAVGVVTSIPVRVLKKEN